MKDAVLVLGMGGPETLEDIKPFLINLFTDKDIINFHIGKPLQYILARFIAQRRSHKLKPQYALMGGGSPQLKHTTALLEKIAKRYEQARGIKLDAYIGMCYSKPFIELEATSLLRKTYRRVYLLPIYPQYCSVTSGAALNRVYKTILKTPTTAPVVTINSYHMYKPFLKAVAKSIFTAAKNALIDISAAHLLLSAHSIPQRIIAEGDIYLSELMEQKEALNKLTKPKSISLAFQSKFGRMQWLTPSVKTELEALQKQGIKDIIAYPVSFINDHIETLVELDIDVKNYASGLGLNFVRAEMFNDSNSFADIMANMLLES
jgi:ferrochelatase